jgi:hypothetical protein
MPTPKEKGDVIELAQPQRPEVAQAEARCGRAPRSHDHSGNCGTGSRS